MCFDCMMNSSIIKKTEVPTMARSRHKKRSCLGRIITLGLLLFIIAYPFYEATTLRREDTTIEVSGLSQALDGLRIVFVSDIHQGPYFSQRRVEDLITKINSFNADVVLLGGDYANDSDGAIAFFKSMPRIHARLFVGGVMGNHDRTQPESNLSVLQSAMIAAGVTPLVNHVATVRATDGSAFYIAGIDDMANGHPDVAGVAERVRQDDFVIFVTHSPDGFAQAFSASDIGGNHHWFDLGLAGHTHGGQVVLLGHPLWRNTSLVPFEYYTGWHSASGADLLVSNGVGTSVLPVRVAAAPTVHVITLKAR